MKTNIRELTKDEMSTLDALGGIGTGPFFMRQLEQIDPRVFEIIERDMTYAVDLPVNTGLVNPGATAYTWRQYDKVGSVKLIAGNGKDLPAVDIGGQEFTSTVEQYGAQLEYTTRELESARFAGMNLDMSKADAIRRAFVENKNRLCYFGQPLINKFGLLNDPSIKRTVVDNGAGMPPSPLWSKKTTAEKFKDIQKMLIRIAIASQGKVKPNVVLMPLDQYMQAVTESFIINGVNITLADQIKAVLGVELRGRPECKNAYMPDPLNPAKVYDIFLAYESSPMYGEFIIARDTTRHAIQEAGLSVLVPYDEVLVGTVIRCPMAFDIAFGM